MYNNLRYADSDLIDYYTYQIKAEESKYNYLIKQAKKKKITIAQHQRLSDVLTEIPTNVLLNKTITGCGATHSEIHAKRNSIIIEPNLPVIDGKCAKHPDIFGVKEGVTKEEIVAYLKHKTDCGYHKILTTPESFPKVRSALYEAAERIYNDWFLLFDEC